MTSPSAPEPAAKLLRTVVVDDEQLARDELCFLLEKVGGVEVIGQAGNGVEALNVIEEYQPDLVMLDVQMPGLTGFEVARRVLQAGFDSQVVFVTAFDQYAINAFEVNAVDYLLKPVEPERLATAVERARKRQATVPKPAESNAEPDLERLYRCSPTGRDGANNWPSRWKSGSSSSMRTRWCMPG